MVFSKDLLLQSCKNQGWFGKGLTHSHTMTFFDAPGKQAVWKTVGKGEIAHNEQFLLFPQCFLPIWRPFSQCHPILNCRLQTLSIWKTWKSVIWGRVNEVSMCSQSQPSPIAQSLVLRTWEQKVAGLIPSLANILWEDWW